MPALFVALLALVLAGVALVAPPRVVLPLLVGTTLLIPASLGMPGSPTPAITVTRLVLLMALLGLLVRSRRGLLPDTAFRLTTAHIAWAGYLLVLLVVGVWLAPLGQPLQQSLLRFFDVVDQLVTLVVMLALVRSAGLRRALSAIIVATAVAALIMALEHVTHASYARAWFAGLPAQQGTDASFPLEQRGGGVRVRGASEFALEAGWVLAAVLPLLFVGAASGRRWLRVGAAPIVALVLAAEAWTVSRSALIGVAVAVIATALLVRARQARVLAVGVAVAMGALLIAVPSLVGDYSLSVDQGSVDVRGERLPIVLGLAAARPWAGLGLGGLAGAGVPTTDASYLLSYAQTGVIGLAVLVVLLVTLVAVSARVLRCPSGRSRSIGGAALIGVVVLLGGAFAFDDLQVLQSARLLEVLVAIAIVAAERELGPARLPGRPTVFRLLPVAQVALVGAGLAVAATPHTAQTSQLLVIPSFREVGLYDPVTAARPVLGNACYFLEQRAERLPAQVQCRDLLVAAGVGQVRVEAANAADLQVSTQALADELDDRGLRFASLVPETPEREGIPTPLRTAPVWASILALGALLLPSRRPRRHTVHSGGSSSA